MLSLTTLSVSCDPYRDDLRRVMGPVPDTTWLTEHIEESAFFEYASKKLPGYSQVLVRAKEVKKDLALESQIVRYALSFESIAVANDCLEVFIDDLVGSGDIKPLLGLNDALNEFGRKNQGLAFPAYYGGLINWARRLDGKAVMAITESGPSTKTRQILDPQKNLGLHLVNLYDAKPSQFEQNFLSILTGFESSDFLLNSLADASLKVKNPELSLLFDFKKALNAQFYKEAYALLAGQKKTIFEYLDAHKKLGLEGFIKDIYNAGRLAGQVTETAKLLEGIGSICDLKLDKAYAFELAGRLWHTLKDQKAALASFKKSFEIIKTQSDSGLVDETDYERVLWYYLREALQSDKPDGILVASLMKHIKKKSYYDDIFDGFLVEAFRKKNEELLQKVYPSVEGFLSPQMAAQYNVVFAFVSKNPLLTNELLDRAYNQNASLYYHVVSALSLKKDLNIESFFHTSDLTDMASSELSSLIDKMIDLSFTDLAIDTAISNRGRLEAGDFDGISKTIEIQNNLPLETRMLEIRKNLFGLPQDRDLLTKTYPQAFAQFVEPQKDRVPPSLQLALIRTESFFNPLAQSGAGAQGLSQFMPETASEIARTLKKDSYDILDPATAILFSAVYLEKLKSKHKSWVQALAAYNAGTGRIKKDILATGHTNMLSYADQLDISETRDYIRRIVESAVLYEYLYGKKDDLFSFAAGLFNED